MEENQITVDNLLFMQTCSSIFHISCFLLHLPIILWVMVTHKHTLAAERLHQVMLSCSLCRNHFYISRNFFWTVHLFSCLRYKNQFYSVLMRPLFEQILTAFRILVNYETLLILCWSPSAVCWRLVCSGSSAVNIINNIHCSSEWG